MMIYRLMWDFGSYQLNLSPWKINILNPKVRKEGTVESHVEVFVQRIVLFKLGEFLGEPCEFSGL